MTARLTRRAMLAASLAAPAVTRAQAPAVLTMWTFLNPTRPGGRETALKQLIESFEAANPGVRVKVEPQVWTTLAEKFVLGHTAGNAPDVCWVNAENLGLIMGSNLAADLKPVVDSWSAERRADQLAPAALDAVTEKGRVLAMPLMATTWVLMARRDLLAAAGTAPDSLGTWDGVLTAAKAMTRDTNGDGQPDVWGMGLGLATERYSMTPAVLGALDAGPLFGKDCQAHIATPAAARAVTWQAELITRHHVTPKEAVAMTSDDAIDGFAAGRFAMEVISNARFDQLQRTAAGWDKNDLLMLPIPGWTAGRPGPALVSGWYGVAWRNSPHVKEATRLIAHLASPEAMRLWTIPGGQVPMLRSLLTSPELNQPATAHLKRAAETMMRAGTSMPSQCAWARTLADFNLATQQVVLGQKSVQDALRTAERATQDRQ